jgi:hypothetical protein
MLFASRRASTASGTGGSGSCPFLHRRGYSRPEAHLIRRNRRWIVHLLCLGLFGAQLGVVLHFSTHLKADTHAAQVCSKCLSSAPLQNMVGGGASVVADANVVQSSACSRGDSEPVPQRGFTGFRSRAPPAIS